MGRRTFDCPIIGHRIDYSRLTGANQRGEGTGRPGFGRDEKISLADVQVGAQFLRRIAQACYAERNPDEGYLSGKPFPT